MTLPQAKNEHSVDTKRGISMILVTGGAGDIASHTVIALAQASYKMLISENFYNSHHSARERLERISGPRPKFIEGDIRNSDLLENFFKLHPAPFHAESVLGWKTSRGLEQMCADSWRWHQRNPEGYQ
jgi:UDP-glucose 4-epimerase